MHDLVIRGALIHDGTGAAPRRDDLAVKDGVLVPDLGYVAGKPPRDAAFRSALDDELGRMLRQAAAAMQRQLEQAWAERAPNLPLKTPEQALILASVIEKETGASADRPMVAAVFINRLRLGMRLQTDPTVIYGLGPAFDGNLRKRDLLADTPYNSYTRAGLPPTPIAMPGLASLRATLQPAASQALYFVARGDGSSQFSATLDEHNQAVRRYILAR